MEGGNSGHNEQNGFLDQEMEFCYFFRKATRPAAEQILLRTNRPLDILLLFDNIMK